MKTKLMLAVIAVMCAVQLFNPPEVAAQACPAYRNAACEPPNPTPGPTPPLAVGVVEPKYIVLAVTYAPPGSSSQVVYSNSTMLGTSTSLSSSFIQGTSQSVSITTGFKLTIGGFSIGSTTTDTTTNSYTQEQDTSSSIAVNQTTSVTTTVRGPSSSAVGLDHDEDYIWVWLNPVLNFTILSPGNIQWNGYTFDATDPVGQMDVYGIRVAYLNGHAPMPSDVAAVLARTWAPNMTDGSGPGLTAADLAAILAADPFSNPSYVINIPTGSSCTADGRFCLAGNQNFQYEPPPPGGQPITQTFAVSHQTTATQGQGAIDTRMVGYSTSVTFTLDGTKKQNDNSFMTNFAATLVNGNSLTWKNQWNSLSTQQVGQTATLSITGPAATDNYTGPVEFDIYQDNVYGSYMFGFIPPATFSVSTAAQITTPVGGCTTETVSVGALVSGFNSTVALNLTASGGLPPGVTATFSPASITGAGSSILTVCTSSATPTGNYSFVVGGVSGIQSHSQNVTFAVTNFSISGVPSSQTTSPGASAAYSVATSAVNGFNGSVALSLSGLPAGMSGSFSSNSITGSGSTTLTITTLSSTPLGSYTFTITGSNGGVTHTGQVTLVVSTPAPPPPGGGGGGGGTCMVVPLSGGKSPSVARC